MRSPGQSRGGLHLLRTDDRLAEVDAFTDLLGDDATRAALVAAGTTRVANYSWERCARETAAVYREALG